jgi:hypothetical protein
VGVIVSRTMEQASAVLGELRAGMNFGVLAKERSSDSTSKDGGSSWALMAVGPASGYRNCV